MPEEMIPIIVVPLMCGTGIVCYLIYTWRAMMERRAPTDDSALRELRDTVARLERRLENMEAIVASAEFSASQTVARALNTTEVRSSVELPRVSLTQRGQ